MFLFQSNQVFDYLWFMGSIHSILWIFFLKARNFYAKFLIFWLLTLLCRKFYSVAKLWAELSQVNFICDLDGWLSSNFSVNSFIYRAILLLWMSLITSLFYQQSKARNLKTTSSQQLQLKEWKINNHSKL